MCQVHIKALCYLQQAERKPLQGAQSTSTSKALCADDGTIYSDWHRLYGALYIQAPEGKTRYIYACLHVPVLELFVWKW